MRQPSSAAPSAMPKTSSGAQANPRIKMIGLRRSILKRLKRVESDERMAKRVVLMARSSLSNSDEGAGGREAAVPTVAFFGVLGRATRPAGKAAEVEAPTPAPEDELSVPKEWTEAICPPSSSARGSSGRGGGGDVGANGEGLTAELEAASRLGIGGAEDCLLFFFWPMVEVDGRRRGARAGECWRVASTARAWPALIRVIKGGARLQSVPERTSQDGTDTRNWLTRVGDR